MLHLEKKLFFIYNPHAGKENIKGKLYGIIQAGDVVVSHW